MPRIRSTFPGFPPAALQFFRDLTENNNKEWFDAHKLVYETEAKAPMENLLGALAEDMVRYAPDYITEPKKAIFRIYRDTRFSKEKIPYKTNIAATCYRQALGKNASASFYFHLDPKEFLIAGGIYMPMPDDLKAIRHYIADHHEALERLIASKPLKKLMGPLQGESLARPPKGFLPGHPAEDLLKRKMYIFWTSLAPEEAEKPSALKEISSRFEAMAPFVEFLNQPLLAARKRDSKTFFA